MTADFASGTVSRAVNTRPMLEVAARDLARRNAMERLASAQLLQVREHTMDPYVPEHEMESGRCHRRPCG